ncbi:MAG: hypothetical protein FJY25_01800 [Betaproteobacteria bacterium]|nr:hypothetical protein [Betaproteobacteria bacterium]
MNHEVLMRTLPLAIALTLISLTATWGALIAMQETPTARSPFAFAAALWPLQALFVWRGATRKQSTDPQSVNANTPTGPTGSPYPQ